MNNTSISEVFRLFFEVLEEINRQVEFDKLCEVLPDLSQDNL